MAIMHEERLTATIGEKRLKDILREKGPQTLDALCAMPEFGWAQALLAVDHLSRSREIVLRLIAPCEYHVSLVEEEL